MGAATALLMRGADIVGEGGIAVADADVDEAEQAEALCLAAQAVGAFDNSPIESVVEGIVQDYKAGILPRHVILLQLVAQDIAGVGADW